MSLVRTALMATAACLISASAYAAPDSDSQSMPAASPDSTSAPPPDNAAPAPSPDMSAAPPTAETGAAATGTASNTSATTAGGANVVASQPVPDTKANREAFGQPLSRAGKRTKAAGN